jgi:hypothetical protein
MNVHCPSQTTTREYRSGKENFAISESSDTRKKARLSGWPVIKAHPYSEAIISFLLKFSTASGHLCCDTAQITIPAKSENAP